MKNLKNICFLLIEQIVKELVVVEEEEQLVLAHLVAMVIMMMMVMMMINNNDRYDSIIDQVTLVQLARVNLSQARLLEEGKDNLVIEFFKLCIVRYLHLIYFQSNKKKDIIDLFKPEGDIPAVKIYRW